MPAVIVLGDKTDHGGEVIEASGFTDTHGRKIARVGDKVVCPKKGHGTTEIVTGDLTFVIDGKAVAYHGCKTSCGATLISSQSVTTVLHGGSGGGAAAQSTQAANTATATAQTATEGVPDEQVKVIDAKTGQPIADLPYYIEAPDGSRYIGYTDADGLCERISTSKSEELTVWLGEEADRKRQGVL